MTCINFKCPTSETSLFSSNRIGHSVVLACQPKSQSQAGPQSVSLTLRSIPFSRYYIRSQNAQDEILMRIQLRLSISNVEAQLLVVLTRYNCRMIRCRTRQNLRNLIIKVQIFRRAVKKKVLQPLL